VRIRSIKPEFWTSEDVASLPWEYRLLFIGLWSYVDDNGVGRDVDRLIASSLFPLEEDPRDTLATVSRGLLRLNGQGLITRYTVDGRPFLHIAAWDKHQRIDKPNKERYEPPTCENAVIRDTLATSSRDSRDVLAPGAGEQGSRGTGEEETPSTAAPSMPTPTGFDAFWDEYPRRVGKQAAIKAWAKAVKHTTPAAILDGALRLAQDPNREDQFTPHPATWLNEGRWEDDRLPARTHTARTRPSTTDAGIAAIQAMKNRDPQRLEIA